MLTKTEFQLNNSRDGNNYRLGPYGWIVTYMRIGLSNMWITIHAAPIEREELERLQMPA